MNRRESLVNQKFFKINYTSKNNTVNNMKRIILAKIRVIHICSSSPHAASVCVRSFLICTAVTETSVAQASDTIIDYHLLPTMMSRMGTTN